jgi:hypothetical protein
MSSFLERLAMATAWPDTEIALMLQVSRPLVQMMRTGRRREYLSDAQRKRLRDELARQRDEVQAIIDEIDLLS